VDCEITSSLVCNTPNFRNLHVSERFQKSQKR
jgi:hypothetical protein